MGFESADEPWLTHSLTAEDHSLQNAGRSLHSPELTAFLQVCASVGFSLYI